jgi:hypothetical protein
MVIQKAQVKCSDKNYKKDWIPACAGMTCFVNHLYHCLSSLRKQGSRNQQNHLGILFKQIPDLLRPALARLVK